ncbi:MAG: HD domain-containing protein, partial [Methylococcales bacterium]|nr:HD domain-containing protein [Methylococcales bacterium]
SAFFYTLKNCTALEKIFPEISGLFGVPQPEQHHPEIDTGLHSMLCLEQAVLLSTSPEVRFAALVHDLGKGLTPKELWPHHYGHETNGLSVLEKLCARLRVPNAFKALSMHVMQYHTHCHRVFELRASTLTDMLGVLSAFKANNMLPEFLLACEADARGRTGFEHAPYPQAGLIARAAKAAASVDTRAILNSELQGAKIGEAIRRMRIKAVAEVINAYKSL